MKLPGSLMQWLSTQFVSNSDLLASLGAFEKRILGNLSLQLEEMQQKPSEETITRTVLQATEQSGLSEEASVKNIAALFKKTIEYLHSLPLSPSSGCSADCAECSEALL